MESTRNVYYAPNPGRLVLCHFFLLDFVSSTTIHLQHLSTNTTVPIHRHVTFLPIDVLRPHPFTFTLNIADCVFFLRFLALHDYTFAFPLPPRHFASLPTHRELDQVSNAIRAEFARGDGRVKRKEDDRRRNIQPSETLFVVNFHEETTKREDLQMLFEPYGELVRIDMKRNYAFVQFRTIDEATRALNATNGGKLDQNVLNVEYVARQRGDPDRRRRRDEPPPRGGDRRGPRPPDRMRGPPRGGPSGGYGDRHDRDRDRDRDRYYDEGPPARGGGGPPPRDDYRPRGGGRDRSPGRAGSPMGYRPRDNYRAVSPAGGYGRRSRSRSRSPPYRSSRSPPRRYDGGGRSDEYRDRRVPPPGPGAAWSPEGYRDRGRSPERDVYRRDDRGYRP